MTKNELKAAKAKVESHISGLSALARARSQRLSDIANLFSDTAWALLPSAVKEILKEFRG